LQQVLSKDTLQSFVYHTTKFLSKMSGIQPVAVYAMKVPPGDILVPAVPEFAAMVSSPWGFDAFCELSNKWLV